VKNRPSDNPLIVHVCNEEMLERLVDNIPDSVYFILALSSHILLLTQAGSHINESFLAWASYYFIPQIENST
jgi:hypothetical protein